MQKIKMFNKLLSSVAFIVMFLLPLQAANFDTRCLVAAGNAYQGTTNDSLNCTAKDADLGNFRVTWIGDGCVNGEDTATVRMAITVLAPNATANNMGVYINTAGQPSAVGSNTLEWETACLHEAFFPSDATGTLVDLLSGVGPFNEFDGGGDTCGDISSASDVERNITVGKTQNIATFDVACADNTGPAGIPDGFVDFAWTLAYDETALPCTEINQTIQATGSKCRQGTVSATAGAGTLEMGVPDLNVTIDCVIKAGLTNTLTCTVNYDNSGIGPGNYIEFHVDYNESIVTAVNELNATNTSNDNGTPDDAAVFSEPDGNQVIRWTLDDTLAIEPTDTGTLTFDLVFDRGNDIGDELNISVLGYYYITDTNQTAQPLLYDEWVVSTNGGTTLPVTIDYVYPEKIGSSLDVSFSTATEVGNVGFNIYAIKGHKWTKLNDELIPGALDSLEPKEYHVSLDIPDLKFNKIGIAGVDVNGKVDRQGPFKIGQESGSKTKVVKVDWEEIKKEVKKDRKARKAAKKAARKARIVAKTGTTGLFTDEIINLQVKENAVYRVTHDDLIGAGINLSGEKANDIAISFRGEGVSRHIDGLNKQGKWTEESYIEFMGTGPKGSDTLYLAANQYQLTLNEKLVVDSEEIEVMTTKELVFEENKAYGNAIPSDDPFYDGFFYAKGSKQGVLTRSIELPKLDQETLDMTVYVSTLSDTNHHLIVYLNDIEVANVTSKGAKEWPIHIKLDENNEINEGSNKLTFIALGSSDDYDMYVYDKLVLSYDDGQPNTSVSPSIALMDKVERINIDPKKGTNYVIISHPLFMGAVLDGYIKHRESEGWNIQLVNVDDIYAAYGYGMDTPDAIKEYLSVAESKGVTHIQLVGASSYDYHDYLGAGSVSFIPSIYVKTNIINYAPSDTMYVSGDTELPKLAIGRWPVRTVKGLEAVINKSLIWKASGQSSSHTALFIADKYDGINPFSQQMERVAQKFVVEGEWNDNDVKRVYMDKYIEDHADQAVNEARKKIKEVFDQGPSVISYSGHSKTTAWSFDALLNQSVVASIQNIEKPSMLLPLACFTTYADSPSVNTMAHQLLVAGENAAVAIYGSARFSTYSENGMLTDKVIDNLLEGKTIGEAVLKSKNALGIQYRDTILNGTLLGDVTLKLR